jgi:hypothetical protein
VSYALKACSCCTAWLGDEGKTLVEEARIVIAGTAVDVGSLLD